jgi:putative transposase
MKEAGLVSRQPGKHRYRLCNRQSNLAENHLSRNFTVNAPDNVWCGDITFIRTQAGWLYLAVVLDLYARKVVGWAFSSVADSQPGAECPYNGLGKPGPSKRINVPL